MNWPTSDAVPAQPEHGPTTAPPDGGPSAPASAEPSAPPGPAAWGWRQILPLTLALAAVAYLVNERLGALPGLTLPTLHL
jgi:hypothetical protein